MFRSSKCSLGMSIYMHVMLYIDRSLEIVLVVYPWPIGKCIFWSSISNFTSRYASIWWVVYRHFLYLSRKSARWLELLWRQWIIKESHGRLIKFKVVKYRLRRYSLLFAPSSYSSYVCPANISLLLLKP